MKFSTSLFAVPAELLILINSATALAPHIVRDVVPLQLPQVRKLPVITANHLSKRNVSSNLGTLSLASQFSNETLFSFGLNGAIAVPGAPNFTATCLSCFTTGSASLLSTDFSQDDNLLEDIAGATLDLIKDPLGFIGDALEVQFEVDLQGLSGHFEVDVSFAGAASFTIPLLPPVQPFGVKVSGNEVGFFFSIDLVFSVNGEVDATAGFDISLPNTTSLIIDPLKGDIMSMDLSGIKVSPLPFAFRAGSACVNVALRFGLQAGIGVNLLGSGFNISAGAFVDAPAYNACATFNASAPCNLAFTESVFGDAGAFAQIAADLNFLQFQEGPSVVTTFFSQDLPGTCIASSTSINVKNQTTTVTQASATSAPGYRNATTTAKVNSKTVTRTSYGTGAATTITMTSYATATAVSTGPPMSTCTITGCKSAHLWCPSSLQMTYTMTKPLATVTTTSYPYITITNAISIIIFNSPHASTIQATTTVAPATTTPISQAAGGNFAQTTLHQNTITTASIPITKLTSTLTSVSASSTGVGAVIVSVGGYQSQSAYASYALGASNASSDGNGTLIQVTSAAYGRDRGLGSVAALVVGLVGLCVLLQ